MPSSTPTPCVIPQPPLASANSMYGFAAAAMLPSITLTDKNRLSWAILDSGASSHFLIPKRAVYKYKSRYKSPANSNPKRSDGHIKSYLSARPPFAPKTGEIRTYCARYVRILTHFSREAMQCRMPGQNDRH